MSNKRDLKKQIRYVCGDLAVEAAMAIHLVPDIDESMMREAIGEVANLQTSTLRKASFAFDKNVKSFSSKADYRKAKAAYNKTAYRTLMLSFNNTVLTVVKKMNRALPAAQKEANKAAASKS